MRRDVAATVGWTLSSGSAQRWLYRFPEPIYDGGQRLFRKLVLLEERLPRGLSRGIVRKIIR
jgi:hypothetical protein